MGAIVTSFRNELIIFTSFYYDTFNQYANSSMIDRASR